MHIQYEAAFADYLKHRGVSYVPVDETRRSMFAGAKIKSFDFLVYPKQGAPWIVDVKGRKFPYVSNTGSKRYWENWVSQADLKGLAEWQAVFGEDFEPRFVFAYWLGGDPDRWPVGEPYAFGENLYAFLSASLADYRQHCRQRSSKWQTVSVPRRHFVQIAKPIGDNGL